MMTSPCEVLRGFETWGWYWQFLNNPLECLFEARRRFGFACALGNPIPFSGPGRHHVLAIGGAYNRQVLSQPDLFRTGGQVIAGPHGSAHQRMRWGLIAIYGNRHRRHRRMMQPPFSRSAVGSYIPMMAQLTDQVLDRWQAGARIDIYGEMRTVSTWMAAHILFGSRDFAASVRLGKLTEEWLERNDRARRFMLRLNIPGSPFSGLLKHAETLEAAFKEMIARNRMDESAGGDVLSIMTKTVDSRGRKLSDTDLIALASTLYGASFETTANALAWTLFLIAQHPSIAVRLREEVMEHLPEWPPDNDALDSMPLLDGVIRESLRLLPPAPLTFRTATEPTEIAGLPMKTGDKIVLSHFITHRNPNIYENPSRFDPDRWLSIRPDPYEFMPFGAGPRLCIGYSFAMTELKLVVARVLQRYRLSVVPNSRIDAVVRITLRPRHSIPMSVHAPDGAFVSAPVKGNIARLVEMTY